MRRTTWLLCLLLTTFGLSLPTSAIEIGGELFVDLNAGAFDPTTDTWANPGSYGDFTKVGAPEVLDVGSHPAVVFDGTAAFVGSELAPETITFDEPRTIEAWVFNPTIANEETIVSWGKRGGPDGTNISFNYGTNGSFGAVGHWGAPDLGWDDGGGAPEGFKWHHLTYTYDFDGVTKVYADGALANEENTLELIGGLTTHEDTAIAIAAQWVADANFDNVGDPAVLEPGLRGTLGIGRLRIHDEALTANQVLANFNEENGDFVSPVLPDQPEIRDPVATPLGAAPVHRYSFDNPVGFADEGAEFIDSIGGAHGVVLGEGAEFTGSSLRLPGGDSASAAYGDLPNGIISSLTDVTIEAWATTETAQNWSRVFDFGSNSPGGEEGELEAPGDDNGGNTEGLDYFMISATRGTDGNLHRLELRDEDPAGGGITTVDATIEKELPDEGAHYTVVYDSDGILSRDFVGNIIGEAPVIQFYYNGELQGEAETDIALSDINDVNNWLGRSNWTNDANFEGTFDEFRIYDYALNQDEVLGSFESGPDMVNVLEAIVGDCNGDGMVNAADLECIIAEGGADGLNGLLTGLGLFAGDLDGDGTVDFDDFVTLSNNFNQEVTSYTLGDINADGVVNFDDFVLLSNNFNQSSAMGAVPEPSSSTMVVLMLMCLAWLQRSLSRIH